MSETTVPEAPLETPESVFVARYLKGTARLHNELVDRDLHKIPTLHEIIFTAGCDQLGRMIAQDINAQRNR